MRDELDERLDDLLRMHLRAELDRHTGKLAHVIKDTLKRPKRDDAGRGAGRRMLIWAVWSAGAIAASVGIVWGVAVRKDVRSQPWIAIDHSEVSTGDAPVPLSKVVQSATADEGTVILQDGGPVRRVHQRTVETTTFYDPVAHATLEVSIPGEQVTFIGQHSY